MSLAPKPRVVVTIHGILTHGKWQKNITPYLAKYGLIPYHIDYGWFGVLKFILPFFRERQLARIRTELSDLLERVGTKRISVIAHSFGTFLAVEALIRENGNFRYDRVVLTGSIVPRDMDWNRLFTQRLVTAVRNERATSDWVVTLAAFVARRLHWLFRLKAGDSGRLCFKQSLPALLDDFVVGHHSDTHNPLKFEQWARFIAYPRLPDDILDKVTTEMSAMREEAARIFGESHDNIRINMFAPIGGVLRIVPNACANMTYAPEFEIKIELGHGATGKAFQSGKPCLVVKRDDVWNGRSLPGTELNKINPLLKWVISLPVKSESRNIIVAVINVDGLTNLPKRLQSIQSEDAQAAVLALYFGFVPRFRRYLDVAFRGDYLLDFGV